MIAEIFPEAYDAEGRPTFRPDQRGKGRPFPSSFPIGRYLSQPLTEKCQTLEELQTFLRKCLYVSDEKQFGKRDFWMPPEDFERTKMGDCEDFALFAWRQILSMGYPARFVLGRAGKYGEGHAWVTFEDHGKTLILEPQDRFFDLQTARLSTLRYKPEISVAWDGSKPHFYEHAERKFVPPVAIIPWLVAEWLYRELLPFLKLFALVLVKLPKIVYVKLLARKRRPTQRP